MPVSFKVGLICVKDSKTSNLAKRFRLTALRRNKQVNYWDLAILGIKFKLSNGMVYMAVDDSTQLNMAF